MRAVLVLAVAGALVVSAASASSTAEPYLVVGYSKIGSFKVQGGTPASATRAFGKPKKVQELVGACEMFWTGLRIGFYTLDNLRQCAPKRAFETATIDGPWVTDRGLRRGDSVVRAKQLYPAARKAKYGQSNIPLVVKFSQAIGQYGLSARVIHGRVLVLDIIDPQGGE